MIPLIDKNALLREMEKASWYNNADRDEVAEELVLKAPIIEIDPDTVSRQAVIENVCTMLRNCFDASDEMIESVKITIGELPPSPSRPKGHWIQISPAGIYECSECGKNVKTNDIEAYEFCHGCGADMRGGAV